MTDMNPSQINLSPLPRTINILKSTKKPMVPTPLTYPFWKTHQRTLIIIAILLCLGLIVTTAVLTVRFTTMKRTIRDCHLNFQQTHANPVEYDDDPRAVAIGDFNHDAQLDVVVVHRAVDRISIFLASNNRTFRTPTIYSTGLQSQPNAVAVAQFRHDQPLDIAVACFGSNHVSIFLGFGDGSFIQHRNISTGSSRPLFIHIAHLDTDTFLDLITVNYGTDSITIFTGDGTGNFHYTERYSTGYDSLPVSIVSGDFNNDRWVDLAVAHSGTNSIGIFIGQSNGAFGEQTILSAGTNSHPSSIVAGYFNGDLTLDLAVANFGSNSICVFLNADNGTFLTGQFYELDEASPHFIGTGDVNNDKRADLIVTNRGEHNIGVFLGLTNGSFTAPTVYSTGSRSSIAAAVRDLNRDNLLDIIVVQNDTKSVNIFFGKQEGFQWETKYSTDYNDSNIASDGIVTRAVEYSPRMRQRRQYGQDSCRGASIYGVRYSDRSLVIVDVNNDTYLDAIVAYPTTLTISIHLGLGNGSLSSQKTNSVPYSPNCLHVKDWNNDEILDMIFAGGGDDSIGMLIGLGNGTYAEQKLSSTVGLLCPKIIVDLNGDGQLDIIATQVGTSLSPILVFLTNDSTSLPEPIVYSLDSLLTSLAIGDVDNDDQLDLIVSTYDNRLLVYIGSGKGTFISLSEYRVIVSSDGMVISDFDNDTHLDIVVVTYNNDNNVGVLLGFGNGSFANPIFYTAGYYAESPHVVDVNNDGLRDLVTLESRKNKLMISFGDGRGSFVKQMTCSTGSYPYILAIGDLNGDTRLDIVVVNGNEPTISVFLLSPMQFSTDALPLTSNKGSRLSSMVVRDFNNDHILDMVVANYGTKTIGVLLGRGDGSFDEQITLPLDPSSNPFTVIAGYFNKDKQLDLVVAHSGSTRIDLLLGDGTGMFERQKTYGYTLKQVPSMILADDLNNDGECELIVAYENSEDIDIYVAYYTGNFTAFSIYQTATAPFSIAVGDFNHDTFLDVVAVNFYAENMSIMFGCGNGSFSDEIIYSIGYGTHSLDVGDFNNDTLIDIVLIHSWNQATSILLSQGNGSFLHSTMPMELFFSSKVRVCFINDDSTPDFIIFSRYSSYVQVFLGMGNGSFVREMNPTVDPSLMSDAAGDLNNDGYIDIVTVTDWEDQLIIKLGFGNGTFVEQPRREIRCAPRFASLGDVNKDGQLDIVISNNRNQTVSVLLGYGDGSFTPATLCETGRDPVDSVLADLNNDTHLDIVILNLGSYTISVLLGDPNLVLNYQKSLFTGNGSRPRAFATGDFNNDTYRDIVVINSADATLGIFLGHANGSFSNQSVYSTDMSPSLIAVGDVNNDHYLDLVIAHSDTSSLSIHLGDGTGSFFNRITFSIDVDSEPKSIVLADFDNDGRLDIILANYVDSNVIVLTGLGNGHFLKAKEVRIGYGTHPFALGVGDFNSDQKLDFAVANYGRDNIEIRLQTC